MSTKIFKCSLDPNSIGQVVTDLQKYEATVREKTDEFRKRVAEYLAEDAKGGFMSAIVDDLLRGGAKHANVDVTTDEKGTTSIVIANGEDAVWAEFGTGVYHNGAVGSSPHSKGAELGFKIGTYGKGHGARNIWVYEDVDGKHFTHGAPASMPMYNAMKHVCDNIVDIAREVFG